MALTAYCDPTRDVGLGQDWQDVLNAAGREVDPDVVPLIFGVPFGPSDNRLDPGRLGSYFRSWETVHRQRAGLTGVMSTGL